MNGRHHSSAGSKYVARQEKMKIISANKSGRNKTPVSRSNLQDIASDNVYLSNTFLYKRLTFPQSEQIKTSPTFRLRFIVTRFYRTFKNINKNVFLFTIEINNKNIDNHATFTKKQFKLTPIRIIKKVSSVRVNSEKERKHVTNFVPFNICLFLCYLLRSRR